MKIKPLKQIDEEACGPTSIKMIADYFGLPFSQEEINKITGYHLKGGLYNKDLVKALQNLGLSVKEKSSTSWSMLKKSNTENNVIVVSWMLEGYIGHFSVVESLDDKHIKIADPSEGIIIEMEKIKFQRLWLDYEPHWYPKKNTDIQLRWMCVVSHSKKNGNR